MLSHGARSRWFGGSDASMTHEPMDILSAIKTKLENNGCANLVTGLAFGAGRTLTIDDNDRIKDEVKDNGPAKIASPKDSSTAIPYPSNPEGNGVPASCSTAGSSLAIPPSPSVTSGFSSDSCLPVPRNDLSCGSPGSEASGCSLTVADTKGSTDSWTDGSMTKDEEMVTNAELGLSEDHFSQPDGHFCLSTMEELEMAIENCKELILEAPEKSEKRKNLIKKLVELRMKLQEAKDGPEVVPPDMKVVLGHHFLKKQIERPKHYCEKCSGIIWGMLQTWHQCADCGFSCHGKCLNLIMRTCASVKVAENPMYITDICPEVGLAAQNYRCAECRTHIMFKNSWVEPRLCDYSGFYYCPNCHWNSYSVIPSRVLHNWDFEQRKVCRGSKQFLRLMRKKAVLRIQDINPMLFSFVEELSLVKKLREEILIMKKYFLACKNALKQKLLKLLIERQHFVDNSDMYSMQDLMDVESGQLIEYLNRIHARFSQHIKEECLICRGQGFICELCDSEEVLFPFDSVSSVCSQCSWVFHSECFIRKERQCPRCQRRKQRAESSKS